MTSRLISPGNTGGTGDVADTDTASGAAGSLFSAGADGVKSIAVTDPRMATIYKDPVTGFAQTEGVTWATRRAPGGARPTPAPAPTMAGSRPW